VVIPDTLLSQIFTITCYIIVTEQHCINTLLLVNYEMKVRSGQIYILPHTCNDYKLSVRKSIIIIIKTFTRQKLIFL